MIIPQNIIDEYDIPLVEIKSFNALIDYNRFFYQPVKDKQEAYEEHIEIARNNDYMYHMYQIKIN